MSKRVASGQIKDGQASGGSRELGSWHNTRHSTLKEGPGLGWGGEQVHWSELSCIEILLPLSVSSGQEASPLSLHSSSKALGRIYFHLFPADSSRT